MKLRTSFFKPIALKKDLFRFAPIWVLYLVGMMLILLEMGSYNDYDNFARNNLPGMVTAFGVVNLCYAGICANLLFGDLYNTKLCYSLHAMPYRRESWLVTHLVSGLLFSLVPNVAACCYLMLKLEAYWFLGLYWLLASTLQFIFFFGLATVSALLTGNRFAMLAVYAGFNFVAMLIYATVLELYLPMLESVIIHLESFSRFSPVVQLFQHKYFTFTRIENHHQDIYDASKYFYRYDGLADGWGYLAILGCVGIAAMGASFWLYRKRHLESAGDFIAFPRLKVLACVIMTLCVTLCFALVGEVMGSGYVVWMSVGLVVGFFGSLMLLERRLKVFRKRTMLGFAAMVVAVVVSMVAMEYDWFGIETWTPKASHVASVTVSNTRNNRYSNGLTVTLDEEADIQQIITAHEEFLTMEEAHNGNHHTVYLTYKMKSGRTVMRYYRLPARGGGYEIVRSYLYNKDSLLGFTDAAQAAEDMNYISTHIGQIPGELHEKMLMALQADAAKGLVSVDNFGKYEKEMYIEYDFIDREGKDVYRWLGISGGGQVEAVLNTPEIAMGYTDWAAFLKGLKYVSLSMGDFGVEIPVDQWEGLLAALRADIENGDLQPATDSFAPRAWELHYEGRSSDGTYIYRDFYITGQAPSVKAWLHANKYTPAD